MKNRTMSLEDSHWTGISIENYPIHERHRLFPEVFEGRNHNSILDVAAGIGVVAKRIIESYDCKLVCNEIDSNCLDSLKNLNVITTSFNLDGGVTYPFADDSFDAVIALDILEHLLSVDEFLLEIFRILKKDGYLYLSVPNYASIQYLLPLLRGKAVHDPLKEKSRYEFYAHVRYFTYHTLIELVRSLGFSVDTVYLALPKESQRYLNILAKSKTKALLVRSIARVLYSMSPRWHVDPVICFRKGSNDKDIRKKLL